jgi:hypothetical protein
VAALESDRKDLERKKGWKNLEARVGIESTHKGFADLEVVPLTNTIVFCAPRQPLLAFVVILSYLPRKGQYEPWRVWRVLL